MKRILFSILALGGLSLNLIAQNAWVNDSVSMGTASGTDVYYSMTTGTAKTENDVPDVGGSHRRSRLH